MKSSIFCFLKPNHKKILVSAIWNGITCDTTSFLLKLYGKNSSAVISESMYNRYSKYVCEQCYRDWKLSIKCARERPASGNGGCFAVDGTGHTNVSCFEHIVQIMEVNRDNAVIYLYLVFYSIKFPLSTQGPVSRDRK